MVVSESFVDKGDGLQPNSDGFQPNSDGLHPSRKKKHAKKAPMRPFSMRPMVSTLFGWCLMCCDTQLFEIFPF